jgi:type I restriction enzyme S subunit
VVRLEIFQTIAVWHRQSMAHREMARRLKLDVKTVRRIVAKIEELLTRLDAGVAALKRAQANLMRYKASVLKAACEGRLVPTEAELAHAEGRTYEPASELLQRILSERRAKWEADLRAKGKDRGKAKYDGPQLPDMNDFPKLPEGWCWAKLGAVFDIKLGGTPSRQQSSYWNGTIPWVSSGEVAFNRISATREGITEEGLNNSNVKLLPPGTVLLGMIGEGKTRGQAAVLTIDATTNQNVAAIVCSETPIPPAWIFYWLWARYEETRKSSSGGMQYALNRERIHNFDFTIPPLAEQVRIVTELERTLSVVAKIELSININLVRAERLRQAVLKRAFSGKLVPQDPNDEPASASLERIRAERTTPISQQLSLIEDVPVSSKRVNKRRKE